MVNETNDKTEADYETQAYWDKEVAYYQERVAAWVGNKMEIDKQIILLSSLGIGLLAQFSNRLAHTVSAGIWVLAALAFLLAIVIMFRVFYLNSKHIEATFGKDSEKQKAHNLALGKLDCYGLAAFIVGGFLTAVTVVIEIPTLQACLGITLGE